MPNDADRLAATYGCGCLLNFTLESLNCFRQIACLTDRDGERYTYIRSIIAQAGRVQPRVINVDGHPAYPELKKSGELGRGCRRRTAPYLNNIIEQDHRFIKKRVTASLGFRSAEGACRTIEGYEAMHAIRKGQIRWVAKGDPVGQRKFIHTIFGVAA